MLTYRGSLGVSRALAQAIARPLLAYRVRIGTRRGRRVLGCFAQAVLLLRFMRQRATIADLARDNAVSLKTAYRYLREAFDVLADQAPELADVVEEGVRVAVWTHDVTGLAYCVSLVDDQGEELQALWHGDVYLYLVSCLMTRGAATVRLRHLGHRRFGSWSVENFDDYPRPAISPTSSWSVPLEDGSSPPARRRAHPRRSSWRTAARPQWSACWPSTPKKTGRLTRRGSRW